MSRRSLKACLLSTTVIFAAAVAIGGIQPAFAQDTAGQQSPQGGPTTGTPASVPQLPVDQSGQPATTVSAIVVTGSRIPQPNLTSVSPVTVVNNQEIKLTGTTRIEDLLNQLPQVFAGQGSMLSNGSDGTATVNLRALGPQRTLVLIDGKRLLPGAPGYLANPPAADLNFIPSALVERVEVLTGGASAVYGSDAVAGVVNFIMKKNFQGVRIDAQYSGYQHDNNDTTIQNLEKARKFNAPSNSEWDGYQSAVNLILGVNSPDGKGNVTAYAGYLNVEPVTQNLRDYSACSLAEAGNGFACSGSGTTSPVDIISLTTGGRFIVDTTGPGNTVRPFVSSRDAFNFAPYNFYQRNDTRYTAGAFGHYQVAPWLDAYTQLMFLDDHTSSQVAPSGIFGQLFKFSCNSPIFSAQEAATFCPNPGQTTTTLSLLRRNVEGGGRVDDLRHTDYRLVIGGRGDLGSNWHYDAYAQFGTAILSENFQNDLSLAHLGNALNVVTGPNGTLQCANAAAVGCAPYNIFSIGGVTPAALNYIQAPGLQEGSTTEQVVSASVSGTLGDYGLKSPLATDGIGVAFGTEYRREALDLKVDNEFLIGDLAGQGGVRLPLHGSYDVYELYVEARVPLIQKRPLFDDLSLELGYRFSDYNTSGTTNAYKIGGDWRIIPDLRLRASYNRAVRAPNLLELFAGQGVVLDGTQDPCSGPTPTASQAACALTGLSAAQYGHVPANSSPQYNGLEGGNPNLTPEKSDTYSIGFVLQPRSLGEWFNTFSLAVDYYDIKVNNVIGTIGADLIITQCVQTGDPFFCNKIHRAPVTGDLFLGTVGYIADTNFNLGSLENRGVDIEANYRLPLSRVGWDRGGSIAFNLVGTYLTDFITQPLPNGGKYNCVGYYGVTCGVPLPSWRHKLRVTWNSPWQIQFSGAWRYIGSVKSDQTSTSPFLAGTTYPADAKLGAQSYFDLAATWRFRDRYTFRAGVNNVFDKDPPLVGANSIPNVFGSGNTFPQVYDTLGRYVFVGVTADF